MVELLGNEKLYLLEFIGTFPSSSHNLKWLSWPVGGCLDGKDSGNRLAVGVTSPLTETWSLSGFPPSNSTMQYGLYARD